jgi:hypothetical protein
LVVVVVVQHRPCSAALMLQVLHLMQPVLRWQGVRL